MAQTDQIEIQIPKSVWKEKSAFIATAYFRLRSTAAAVTPTTVHYRVDDLTTGLQLQDWTSVSTASNVSIAITATFNAIQDDSSHRERKQLTVKADDGLDTQHIETIEWQIVNLLGLT